MNSKKVMVAMSGGVDSSVTAYLLQKQGYDIEGVYMKLHNAVEGYHEKNIKYVKSVAQFLNIKYHILDLSEKFEKDVYNYFVESYAKANTPNPCVMCNKTIKFGALLDFTKENDCEMLATGHYAKTDGNFIYEAEDKTKDQSYFLAQVDKNALKHIMFPMSEYHKDDIRKIALGISELKHVAIKKDSQEICFVENSYTDVLALHNDINKQGDVLNESGEVVGNHKGYMHYTIGKRRGFYVKGAHEAHFVKEINPVNNTIVVCQKEGLQTNRVVLSDLNMYIDDLKFSAGVKLRYRSFAIDCEVDISNDRKSGTVVLNKSAYGVASGQIAVFYKGEKVLGSAVIVEA